MKTKYRYYINKFFLIFKFIKICIKKLKIFLLIFFSVKIIYYFIHCYQYPSLLGYNITLNVDPIALGGKLVLNLALTIPLFPWLVATLPHITLIYIHLYIYSIFSILFKGFSFINISNSLSKIISSCCGIFNVLNS